MNPALIQSHGLGLFGLDWPDLTVFSGEHWLIRGPSGSGKSTLLMLLAGLYKPQQGEIQLAATTVIGLVPQEPGLLRAISVLDNLLLAQTLRGRPAEPALALRLLAQLGLEGIASRRPATLSRGQQQRVAIARALLIRPALLLVDEPSANLDDDNALRMIDLLQEQVALNQAGLLVTSHDQRLSDRFDNVINLPARDLPGRPKR